MASEGPTFAALAARVGADPADSDAAFDLAALALRLHREDVALPLVQRSAERLRTDAALWQYLGLLHRALDDHAAAARALATAARLSPRDGRIAHARARVALEAGLPAVEAFEAAHTLSPNDGDILLGLAAARFAAGDAKGAIAGLDAMLAANPGWFPGHELAARLRWMSGDRAGHLAALDRAIAAVPADPRLWHCRTNLLIEAEDFAGALDTVHRGRARAGSQLAFDLDEAICASELGDVDRADRLFRAAPDDDASLAVHRARHLLRSGRAAEVEALCQPWLDGEFANMVWPYLGLAWRLLGDPRQAWLDDERLVAVIDLPETLPDLPALAERLRTLHRTAQQHMEQSVRGGTQTNGPLFSRVEPEIQRIRAALSAAVAAHVATLPVDVTHPTLRGPRPERVRFSGSWSVRLTGGGFHANHLHPQGWLSSAFYVTLPDAEPGGDPAAGWLALGEPQAALGLDLPPRRLVEPRPGRLVLFPSTMWHGTRPFPAGERMTIAFDVAGGVR